MRLCVCAQDTFHFQGYYHQTCKNQHRPRLVPRGEKTERRISSFRSSQASTIYIKFSMANMGFHPKTFLLTGFTACSVPPFKHWQGAAYVPRSRGRDKHPAVSCNGEVTERGPWFIGTPGSSRAGCSWVLQSPR